MKTQVRRFDVKFNLNWSYDVSISKIREDLDKIEAMGATHVEIEYEDDGYGYISIITKAKSERMETDEEYKARIEKIKQRKEKQRTEELAQLEKLKSKYGL